MTEPHPAIEMARLHAGPHAFTWLSAWVGTGGRWVASVQAEGKECQVAHADDPFVALLAAMRLSIEAPARVYVAPAAAQEEVLDTDGY